MAGLLHLLVFVSLAAFVIGQLEVPEDCGPCDVSKCVSPDKCPAGRTLDRCQCCETCSKGLYELCKHPDAETREDVQYVDCGQNLECRLREDIPDTEGAEAICYCIQDEPVCGNDGNTYENICHLRAVQNMGKSELDKVKVGPCTSAPQVVTGPENVKNKTGADITLSCEVTGFPIPTVDWTFTRSHSKPIHLPTDDFHMSVSTRGGPEKFQVTGFLQIEDLKKMHEGDYSCVATNEVDSAKASARVKVIEEDDHDKKSHKRKHPRGGNDL